MNDGYAGTRILKLAFVSLVFLFSGCTSIIKKPDAPIPESFPVSLQKHVQAAHHWSLIANDLADQVSRNLELGKLSGQPVFVNPPVTQTDFNQAFNDFLIASLMQKGVKVSSVKHASTVLNYKVQPIKFNSNRNTMINTQAKWTALAAGLIVFRNVADWIDLNSAETNVLTGAVLADIWQADGAPKLELIVSSSIVNNDIYVMKTTDVYYANKADMQLYERKEKNGHGSNRKNVFDDPFYKLQ